MGARTARTVDESAATDKAPSAGVLQAVLMRKEMAAALEKCNAQSCHQ
jgi:hypothetical protein